MLLDLATTMLDPALPRQDAGRSTAVPSNGWAILAVLGEGGIGRVLRVRNLLSGATAALKQILPQKASDQVAREMFRREGDILLKLRGARHVVQLHRHHVPEDADTEIVMEVADGGTLETWCEDPASWHHVLPLACETLIALEDAHSRRIAHLDIKPANILLDGEGHVKLADWGLGRDLREPQPEVKWGFVPCTPLYMSPEIAELQAGDERSDIYSFGCSLYELLTGVRAFDPDCDSSCLELMLRHTKEDGPDPRKRNRRLPRGLAEAVQHAMRCKPEARFQTAREMREAIEWHRPPVVNRISRSLNPLRWLGIYGRN